MHKSKRDITGILLLDKPAGISSNAALQQIKRLFNARKAGHTGSLDPLATGMLPICFGEATKFSQFLLHADKTYQVTAQLGAKTATGDAEGEIVQTREIPPLTPQKLEPILAQFRGVIQQIPSMYSALKHKGRPLYKLARQGIEVERPPRQITIYSLALCNLNGEEIELQLRCSSGTYVRTLIEDIGEALGCGAYVTALRRVQIDPYQVEQMVDLSTIQQCQQVNDLSALDNLLLPIDSALGQWPALYLEKNTAFYLQQGNAVVVPHAPASGMVRLYHKNNEFIGIGVIDEVGKVAPRRLLIRGV